MAVSARPLESRSAKYVRRWWQPAPAPPALSKLRLVSRNQRNTLPQLRHQLEIFNGRGKSQSGWSFLRPRARNHGIASRQSDDVRSRVDGHCSPGQRRWPQHSVGNGRRDLLSPGHERAVRNLRSTSVVSTDHRDVSAWGADSHRLQYDVADATRSRARRTLWFRALFFSVHRDRSLRIFGQLLHRALFVRRQRRIARIGWSNLYWDLWAWGSTTGRMAAGWPPGLY